MKDKQWLVETKYSKCPIPNVKEFSTRKEANEYAEYKREHNIYLRWLRVYTRENYIKEHSEETLQRRMAL